MVDKVSVNPLSVRGAGDIVSPKTASDFDVFNSTITSSSEDVDGATMTVYTVSYVNGTYFKISSDNIIPVGETSFTVSAVLKKNSDDSVVSGASVSCTVNGDSVLTGTTDSNGSVSFTIPTMEDVPKYTVKLVYSGTDGIGGAFKVTGLICVDLTTLALALTGNKTITQTNDSCALIATLTGIGVDGERIGVPGQTVTVYEEYTPAWDITATPQIIQSSDNTSIILQLKDEEDGSLVRESGLTIDLYSNVALFKSFTLTSDKDALSYYDEESAVLTATYLEDNVGVSGKSVVFKNGNTVLDTVVTDSNGEAEYTYASQGVGDVTITAECMGLQETYGIEDCLVYRETLSIQGDTILNYALPSSFSLDFTIYSTLPTTDPSIAYVRFESSTSSKWIGKGGSTSRDVYFFGTVFNTIANTYTDYDYSMTYENGVATLTDGTTTETSTQSLSTLYQLTSNGGSQLKNIKIKPL